MPLHCRRAILCLQFGLAVEVVLKQWSLVQ